ncbi:MAG TPA: LytTR family DNA-binding domain-containing protein [Gemmatimonadaceae bacterium]|nr:LytTR family DNA-binding domain-containing protein [Gemmatimonadaceae bacterium]
MADLRVLIVDDEPLVREGIRTLLQRDGDVDVVGEARNGIEALEQIRTLSPALVFLDVQMPGLDGLAVLEELSADERPAVVFVTAYDEYALRAFDVNAVDYLLKPFDAERFGTALARARERLRSGDDRVAALLASLQRERRYADRLLLKQDGALSVVLVDDIDWIEAADNYVKVHARTGRYMVRDSLKALEVKLDPARFARAHRSAIVNLTRVKSLTPLAAGEYVVTLATGTRLTLSRGYRDSFRARLAGERMVGEA